MYHVYDIPIEKVNELVRKIIGRCTICQIRVNKATLTTDNQTGEHHDTQTRL